MSANHIVQLPKAVWAIKVAQLVIAALVLVFAIVVVAIVPYSNTGYDIFTGIFSIIILVYFFVAIHAKQELYNWVALLVLECLAVIFWLSAWAVIASELTALAYISSYDNTVYYKRDLSKRLTESSFQAAEALFYCVLALSIIEFILYCVTLGFMGKGIHDHRMAGRPMVAGHSGGSAWGSASRAEKNEMHPVSTSTSSFSHGHNPGATQYDNQQQYPSAAYPSSGMSPNAHEVPSGNRY